MDATSITSATLADALAAISAALVDDHLFARAHKGTNLEHDLNDLRWLHMVDLAFLLREQLVDLITADNPYLTSADRAALTREALHGLDHMAAGVVNNFFPDLRAELRSAELQRQEWRPEQPQEADRESLNAYMAALRSANQTFTQRYSATRDKFVNRMESMALALLKRLSAMIRDCPSELARAFLFAYITYSLHGAVAVILDDGWFSLGRHVGARRLDFAFVRSGPDSERAIQVGVVLDDHERSDMTETQSAQQHERDQALGQAGWTVRHIDRKDVAQGWNHIIKDINEALALASRASD